MKIKLDENLGTRGRELLRTAGHDVCTVIEQGLQATADGELIEACRQEGRCMVTLDLDFANPLVYLPSLHAGIAVLRLPARPSPVHLASLVQTLVKALEKEPIIPFLAVKPAFDL